MMAPYINSVTLIVTVTSTALCCLAYVATSILFFRELGHRDAITVSPIHRPYTLVRQQLKILALAGGTLYLSGLLIFFLKRSFNYHVFPDCTEAFYVVLLAFGFGLTTLLL